MAKESICRNCFHSYVCEQFNENKDDSNEKCHFSNDHYVSTADVVPKSEVDKTIAEWAHLHADVVNKLDNAKAEVAREIFEEIEDLLHKHYVEWDFCYFDDYLGEDFDQLKKKYTEGESNNAE